MENLPDELLVETCENLSIRELLDASMTSKKINAICRDIIERRLKKAPFKFMKKFTRNIIDRSIVTISYQSINDIEILQEVYFVKIPSHNGIFTFDDDDLVEDHYIDVKYSNGWFPVDDEDVRLLRIYNDDIDYLKENIVKLLNKGYHMVD